MHIFIQYIYARLFLSNKLSIFLYILILLYIVSFLEINKLLILLYYYDINLLSSTSFTWDPFTNYFFLKFLKKENAGNIMKI